MVVRETSRLNRRQILAGALAASILPPFQGGGLLGALSRGCCPVRVSGVTIAQSAALEDLIEGNRVAVAVASRSSLIGQAWDGLREAAYAIEARELRLSTLTLLELPAPTYQNRSPSWGDREQVRQELLAAGLIPEATTVDGIFPPVQDANEPAQPVWSAPGGTFSGHHAYPGGLAMHEWVSAGIADSIKALYQRSYGIALDPSITLAAPLWHDIHKTTVMQWKQDGSELAEQTIADTGAHHTISGAEAIVRGMSRHFVIAMLSAHNAATTVKETLSAPPVLTGYQRLVNYVRAAAIIARADPISRGLLKSTPEGEFVLNQDPPRMEGFLNHFADQDYVLTGDVAARMIQVLGTIAGDYGIDPANEPARFNLFRNLVFSQVSDMRLYEALLHEGVASVKGLIDADVDLSQLAGPP
jgi:hypothetical protein